MIITYGTYILSDGKLCFSQYEVEEGPKYWCGINGDCCFKKDVEDCVLLQSSNYRPYLEVFTTSETNAESHLRLLFAEYFKNLAANVITKEAQLNLIENFDLENE